MFRLVFWVVRLPDEFEPCINKCNNNNNNNHNNNNNNNYYYYYYDHRHHHYYNQPRLLLDTHTKQLSAGRCSPEKIVCTDNNTEKNYLSWKKFSSPPLQKNNGPSLSLWNNPSVAVMLKIFEALTTALQSDSDYRCSIWRPIHFRAWITRSLLK